jgi:hypothetical protein
MRNIILPWQYTVPFLHFLVTLVNSPVAPGKLGFVLKVSQGRGQRVLNDLLRARFSRRNLIWLLARPLSPFPPLQINGP